MSPSPIPSRVTPDARAVVRALDALTTQVRRVADRMPTPVVEQADTTDDDATTTADTSHAYAHAAVFAYLRRIGDAMPGSRLARNEMIWQAVAAALDARPLSWITQGTRDLSIPAQAPAAAEDTQRADRRASLRNLLGRAAAGLTPDEDALLRQHVEAEQREADQWRAGRNTMKRRGEEIEQDRDRIAAELEKLRAVLEYEHKRADDAIDRETTAEQAAEEQRERARIAEGELRMLRTGIRALGGDPTTIQNLWAQLHLRNRQWAEAKREVRLTRSMLEEEGGDVSVVDEMIATVTKAEQEVREAQAAIERVREAMQWARRHHPGLIHVHDRLRAALDGTEQPTTEEKR